MQTEYLSKTTTSKDGTVIGYRQLGQGPGLILVQGTMGSAQNFQQLSEALAQTFTVYVPDRRDRGMSGKGKSEYMIQREVEDLDALLTQTGATYVFGLSSGAIISLQAALSLPAIHKLAVFEPPLFTKETLPIVYVNDYEAAMAQGNIPRALVAGMKAGKFAPPLINALPNKLLEMMVGMGIKQEEKKGSKGYIPMGELARTLHNDFLLIQEVAGKTEDFKDVHTEILMLGGSKSQTYLKEALDALGKVLSHATRTLLPGLNHSAAWNSDRGGKPELVANELRKFFMH